MVVKTLFAARIAQEHLPPLCREARKALAVKAFELYEQCWRALPRSDLATPLPGGWRTAANMRFFKAQVAHARALAELELTLADLDGAGTKIQTVLDNLTEIDKWELRRLLREEGILIRIRPREVELPETEE